MGAGKTCCSLVVDPTLSRPTDWRRGGGGPCTVLGLGLRSEGLESKFGRGPRHPGQESDGVVLLVPGVQARRVFRGTQLGALIRESPGNPVWLVCGLARSKN